MSIERLAAELAKHERVQGIRDLSIHCSCGWIGEPRQGIHVHRSHVAEVIAEAAEARVGELEKDRDGWEQIASQFRSNSHKWQDNFATEHDAHEETKARVAHLEAGIKALLKEWDVYEEPTDYELDLGALLNGTDKDGAS
jgi:hypothetical protein